MCVSVYEGEKKHFNYCNGTIRGIHAHTHTCRGFLSGGQMIVINYAQRLGLEWQRWSGNTLTCLFLNHFWITYKPQPHFYSFVLRVHFVVLIKIQEHHASVKMIGPISRHLAAEKYVIFIFSRADTCLFLGIAPENHLSTTISNKFSWIFARLGQKNPLISYGIWYCRG